MAKNNPLGVDVQQTQAELGAGIDLIKGGFNAVRRRVTKKGKLERLREELANKEREIAKLLKEGVPENSATIREHRQQAADLYHEIQTLRGVQAQAGSAPSDQPLGGGTNEPPARSTPPAVLVPSGSGSASSNTNAPAVRPATPGELWNHLGALSLAAGNVGNPEVLTPLTRAMRTVSSDDYAAWKRWVAEYNATAAQLRAVGQRAQNISLNSLFYVSGANYYPAFMQMPDRPRAVPRIVPDFIGSLRASARALKASRWTRAATVASTFVPGGRAVTWGVLAAATLPEVIAYLSSDDNRQELVAASRTVRELAASLERASGASVADRSFAVASRLADSGIYVRPEVLSRMQNSAIARGFRAHGAYDIITPGVLANTSAGLGAVVRDSGGFFAPDSGCEDLAALTHAYLCDAVRLAIENDSDPALLARINMLRREWMRRFFRKPITPGDVVWNSIPAWLRAIISEVEGVTGYKLRTPVIGWINDGWSWLRISLAVKDILTAFLDSDEDTTPPRGGGGGGGVEPTDGGGPTGGGRIDPFTGAPVIVLNRRSVSLREALRRLRPEVREAIIPLSKRGALSQAVLERYNLIEDPGIPTGVALNSDMLLDLQASVGAADPRYSGSTHCKFCAAAARNPDVFAQYDASTAGRVFASANVEVEFTPMPFGEYGMVTTDGPPFKVYINTNEAKGRARLSLAHELVHVADLLGKLNLTHEQVQHTANLLVTDIIPAYIAGSAHLSGALS